MAVGPTAAAAINTGLPPAVAACMSPDLSTSTPAPMQSVDAARVISLEARMDEQSALIASLAQGMHEMLQQVKQLRCDTVGAASAPGSATAASAPRPAEHGASRTDRAGKSSHTPTVPARPAPEVMSRRRCHLQLLLSTGGGRRTTPHARDPPSVLEARATVTRPVMGDGARPGRLAPVAEASITDEDSGGHTALGPRRTGRISAQGAQAQSAPPRNGTDRRGNTDPHIQNAPQPGDTVDTPTEDPSLQLQFGQSTHPSLVHSGVQVMSHGNNTHASAVAAGYHQFSHGGDTRPLHYVCTYGCWRSERRAKAIRRRITSG
eukprot:3448471-Pleurochrysis_carterae.AAC.5